MKKKWMLVLVAAVVLALQFGAFQHAFAAERTMVIRVPQCVWDESSNTVRFTVSHINGVKSVDANPITQSVTIVFDDTKTNFDYIKRKLMEDARMPVLGEPQYK